MNFQEIAKSFFRKSTDTSSASREGAQKFKCVLLIGAGTMGTQIAVQCASDGRFVFLCDNLRAAIEKAPSRVQRLAQDLFSIAFGVLLLCPGGDFLPDPDGSRS